MDATTQFEDIGHKDAEKYMKDLYIGDYVFQDGQAKNDYPKQIIEPEFSLATRIGLALIFVLTAFALFTFIDNN